MFLRKTLIIALICLFIAVPALHAQEPPTAQTTATGLNMRTAPNVEASVIATLPYGTQVTLHGRNAGGRWILVQAEAGRGWVSAYYLKTGVSLRSLPVADETGTADSSSTSPGTATTTANLRLREGPGEQHDIVVVLPRGTAVTLGNRSNNGNWVHVTTAAGQSGWVSTCCITSGSPAGETTTAAPAPTTGDSGAEWPMNIDFVTIGSRTRSIYLRGLAMGRNPHAFSKMGDCATQTAFLFAFFDRGEYNLAGYSYLQPVIDHYRGSFVRDSLTVWGGGAAFMAFDPLLAKPGVCNPGETPIACEFRIHNPSAAIIAFGQNDGPTFAEDLRKVVRYAIDSGVVPILSTKANIPGEGTEYKNGIIRQVAAEYGVPLWDWGKVASAAPQEKLWDASGHLLWYPLDYRDSEALFKGHSLRNLTGLITLYTIWQQALY